MEYRRCPAAGACADHTRTDSAEPQRASPSNIGFRYNLSDGSGLLHPGCGVCQKYSRGEITPPTTEGRVLVVVLHYGSFEIAVILRVLPERLLLRASCQRNIRYWSKTLWKSGRCEPDHNAHLRPGESDLRCHQSDRCRDQLQPGSKEERRSTPEWDI